MKETISVMLYNSIGEIETLHGKIPMLDEISATNKMYHLVEGVLKEFAVWLKRSPYEIIESAPDDNIWGNIWDEKDTGYSTEGIVELFLNQKIKMK